MRRIAKRPIGVMLLFIMLLLASNTTAAQEASPAEPIASVEADVVTVPDMSEIIPMAAKLSGQLAALENKVQSKLDFESLEDDWDRIRSDIAAVTREMQRLKDSGDFRTDNLIVLRQKIEQKNNQLNVISKPLKKEIQKLFSWRKQWLGQQQQYDKWKSVWLDTGIPDQVQKVLFEVHNTIAGGLDLIDLQLESALSQQEKTGDLQEQLYALDAELESLVMAKRFGTLSYSYPPMFSSQYLSQFKAHMWKSALTSSNVLLISGVEYWQQLGWIVSFQVFGFLIISLSIQRNLKFFKESEHWHFIADRRISASLFLIGMITMMFYEYEGFPVTWKLMNWILISVPFARLACHLTAIPWKRQFVYGLVAFLILVRLFEILDIALPIFRLFIILTGITAFLYCLKWAIENKRLEKSYFYNGLLRLGAIFFLIVIFSEIWGKDALAYYLYVSVAKSILVILMIMLFTRMIHGGVQWMFTASPARQAAVLYSNDIEAIVQRTMLFIKVAVWGLFMLPGILLIWGMYDSLQTATISFWKFGFNIGSQRISVGLVIVFIAVLYGSFVISWSCQKIFLDVLLRKKKVQRGVRLSIERLIHYAVIFIGFLLAISIIGFDLTKFTILISALGVGIGFGLQSVVNNFVSGLILLFEQPVRQGDIVEVTGIWAEVKNIGLRATTVRTFDQADLIIPNADLTTNQVTNWTLSSRQVRLIIPVGVAYGSDVPLVFEMLTECAQANDKVAKTPEPMVLFLKFGESSLDFELRVWIIDTDFRLRVRSQLHQEIDRRFREKNIVIAFPQRDVHLQTPNESAVSESLQADT